MKNAEGLLLHLSLCEKLLDLKEALSTDHHLPQCCEKNVILSIDCHLEAVREVVSQIQDHIDKREELTKVKHSDQPIADHARRSYWEGYIDAKKEDKALLEGSATTTEATAK